MPNDAEQIRSPPRRPKSTLMFSLFAGVEYWMKGEEDIEPEAEEHNPGVNSVNGKGVCISEV